MSNFLIKSNSTEEYVQANENKIFSIEELSLTQLISLKYDRT